MENVLISACLLGLRCRYDGKSKPLPESVIAKLQEHCHLIPNCPEIGGGLPTPRVPSEVQKDGTVKNKAGTDVTEQYTKGAEDALRLCKILSCKTAILKEKSPSCGKNKIYDGTFTKTLTDGDGMTVRLLRANGIRVIGESEIDAYLAE